MAAAEEEPWLGSGSVFKVESMFADKPGLGHERKRSKGCVRHRSNWEGLGQDLGVGDSALGLWRLRCPCDGQGEQAVAGAWGSGACHQAVGGLGVSGEREEGSGGLNPGLIRVLSGDGGGGTSREAEEEGGPWERRARLPAWSSAAGGQVCGELAGGRGAGNPQTTAWPCWLGCTFF